MSVVKISPDFNSINVFWIAKGDENDENVERTLKLMSGPLRHELSQLRLMGEVPRIYFVKDRFFSKAVEVDILLKRADFGNDFVPTDQTLFMKASPQLNIPLSEEMRSRILELEQIDDDVEDEELPEMRQDVLGLDHAAIMKKIATSIDRSRKAWESFGTHSESIMSTTEPCRDIGSLDEHIAKINREADVRNEFVKFLEQKQYQRRNTPERKKHKDLNPQNDDDNLEEDRRESSYDEDYIEEEHEPRK